MILNGDRAALARKSLCSAVLSHYRGRGVVVGIVEELGVPVKFIGIGEQVDDLRPFDAEAFVSALLG